MSTSIAELQTIWDQFLDRWPLEKLPQITLVDYTAAGTNESFCYWLEEKTEELGSFWGGSAFKFGIFSRKDKGQRENGGGASYIDDYAWYSKYGDTVEAAFAKVKALLVQVATAARNGRFEDIDEIDLGPAFKWKLAFLYQDRVNLVVLPVLKPEVLRRELGEPAKDWPASRLHRHFSELRGAQSVFEQATAIWARHKEWLAQQLSPAVAQEWLECCGLFTPIKEPSKYVAGFQTADGRQLALIRETQKVTLFLMTGDWLEAVQDRLDAITPYGAEASRNSNLAANAPQLATGHEVVSVKVPTLEALVALAEAYAGGVAAAVTNALFEKESRMDMARSAPLNQILFGPPGTGKTYEVVEAALKVIEPEYFQTHRHDRKALKDKFDALMRDERIRFVTFHQSFSYEDFVEGIRATTNAEGQLEYDVEPGVFRLICEAARNASAQLVDIGVSARPRVWKISIDGTGFSETKRYCLEHGEARIGWGHVGDLRQLTEDSPEYNALGSGDKGTLRYFADVIQKGDILVCIRSATTMAAVGVVTGQYRFEPHPPAPVRDDYKNVLPVDWIYPDLDLSILPLNDDNEFTLKTVYKLNRISWGALRDYLEREQAASTLSKSQKQRSIEPYVLIIDEINRGNISRIFGELITLIEPSKRAGAPEELSVTLPYSRQAFSVPGNVYLIGTMNTADRSLAALDIALRRRFVFLEMPPRPELLNGMTIEGIDVAALLRVMNQRIEVLLDRDHCLGHAYFLPLKDDNAFARLAAIFRDQILPLLQEYFFEDWERIRWVLNDQNAPADVPTFIRRSTAADNLQKLFGNAASELGMPARWELNPDAFTSIASFRNVLGAT